MNFNKHITKELLNEYAGSEKKKTVLLDDNKKYLLKFPDPSRRTDLEMSYINNSVSEYLGCRILKNMGFETQNVILGIYTDERNVTKIACACEDVRKPGEILHEINKLELESLNSSSMQKITFDSEKELFKNIKVVDYEKLESFYYKLFVADAFIGNPDRHNGNWALISNNYDVNIAPIYDCGSSLCPLVDDTEINETTTRIYALNEPSAISDTNGARIRYVDYFKVVKDKDMQKAMIEIIPKINMDNIKNIIDSTDYISNKRKQFYKDLLEIRYERILIPSLSKVFQPECTVEKDKKIDYYKIYRENFNFLKNLTYEKQKINIQGKELEFSKAGTRHAFCYINGECVNIISTRSNHDDIRDTINRLQSIGVEIELPMKYQQQVQELSNETNDDLDDHEWD